MAARALVPPRPAATAAWLAGTRAHPLPHPPSLRLPPSPQLGARKRSPTDQSLQAVLVKRASDNNAEIETYRQEQAALKAAKRQAQQQQQQQQNRPDPAAESSDVTENGAELR